MISVVHALKRVFGRSFEQVVISKRIKLKVFYFALYVGTKTKSGNSRKRNQSTKNVAGMPTA